MVTCGGKKTVKDLELGSSINREGTITDHSLIFTFDPYSGGGTLQDLCNYLYFKGDTLCFSFTNNREYNRDNLKIWFIDPADNSRFVPERIDYHDGRVSGFSLVGTLLEQFLGRELQQPVPPDHLCCEDIPFIFRVELITGEGLHEMEREEAFRIRYR
jgi:hypothetical protein